MKGLTRQDICQLCRGSHSFHCRFSLGSSIRNCRGSQRPAGEAVAAVNEDKAKALDMFNQGEGGFKDRDLYVFCANASDGIVTAH
jgi:hypothetical protein